MLLFRKILFFVFTAIYIIVCPLLILYSLGYVYNPVQQQLVRTGIVSLSTLPPGAFVFLEKSRYVYQTPVDIRELLPGNYTITLRKKGYKPWSHLLSVEAGKAVAFENILLIPDKWPTKDVNQQSFTSLFPLEGNQYKFLVTAEDNLGSFRVYDEGEALQPLLSSGSVFSEVPVKKVYSVPKSSTLLISCGTFWDKRALYLSLDEKEPIIKDITKLFGEKPSFIAWQGDEAEQIYTIQDNCVNRIDVKKQQRFACEWDNIRGFGLHDEWVYVIDPNGMLYRKAMESKKREILSEDTSLSKNLFNRSGYYRITVKDKIITFLGTEGDFIANVPPYNIASQGIVGFSFHNDRNLLYWGKNSISIVDFSVKSNDTVFQEQFTAQPIYEKARDIKQGFWAYKDSHILFNDAGTIYLIEIEPQGLHHVEPVCRIRKNSNVFYDGDKHTLYYLHENDGRLSKLRIFPD